MVKIAKNVFWSGYKHWELRSFHGSELSTHRASTYNAYVIKDKLTALVDTVWDPFKDDYIAAIDRDVGFSNVDLVVINHAEPDHAGSLGHLMENLRPGTPVYCTKAGEQILRRYFGDPDWRFVTVKTGDTVSLGEYELVFVEMKMMHWPDSMITYVNGARVALSSDAFGQHFCASGFFDDEVDEGELRAEALKYYANILSPYAQLLGKKIRDLEALKLDIETIAPSHGLIWRSRPERILKMYADWSDAYEDGSAVVTYDGFYNATFKMASAIAEGVAASGAKYRLAHCATSDMSDLLTDMFRASAVIVGSSTINNSVHRTTAALLDEIKGHKLRGKLGAAFGSYGWSGESAKIIESHMIDAGFKMVDAPLRSQYSPAAGELSACYDLGKKVGEAAKARAAARIAAKNASSAGTSL